MPAAAFDGNPGAFWQVVRLSKILSADLAGLISMKLKRNRRCQLKGPFTPSQCHLWVNEHGRALHQLASAHTQVLLPMDDTEHLTKYCSHADAWCQEAPPENDVKLLHCGGHENPKFTPCGQHCRLQKVVDNSNLEQGRLPASKPRE